VAPDQGRQAATAGRRSLIFCGWLGCVAGLKSRLRSFAEV
jgi:hypothetical protein